MIKFALRRNLIYPLQLLIFNVVRDVEKILIELFLDDTVSLIYTPLMFLGEFFSGLIIYYYQRQFMKSNKKTDKYKKRELIHSGGNYVSRDGIIKIMLMIFFASFFDFVQFLISLYTPKFINTSGSIGSRLGGFLTIFDALFYYYVLRLPIYRHQFFSLIVIGTCLILVIVTEFIFQEINIFLSYGRFISVFLIILVEQFCSAMVDSNEKYLFEYNSVNPFFALMFEGFFGFTMSFFYGLYKSPFLEVIEFQKKTTTSNFTIFIFALILYSILSGLKNSFRVSTTKKYTPMTTTFLDYILNPIYLIIYFSLDEDFIVKGEKNYIYFIINLILALIISFFGFVYNEFILLFCWNLELDTHEQVSRRASLIEEDDEEEVYDMQDIAVEEIEN